MRKFLPLLLAPMLVACGASDDSNSNLDITELRVACEKESGFSGDAMVVTETGTVFVWRADGEMVAECQGHNKHVHLVSIF